MRKFEKRQVGVLALQGDYERHQHQLGLLRVKNRLVRLPADLTEIDSLIIPGGESTTMDILLDRFHLREPLTEFGRSHPVYGTCAGMIMVATSIRDNQAGVKPLGLIDIEVVRMGYGRQVHSFEEILPVSLGNGTSSLTATFIRAPRIARTGPDVTVLASYKDHPVLVRRDNVLAGSFHTELDDDTTLLRYFIQEFS
ncbi:MAG: pyridoxal 5'-phosphate synthase glutaminase subunit PdxT [candidate division Zixibacteria bacterium]|nr:pyridoxal 5'-phosphate synthase glutaminase subunit PdxT [candidate division Zixibacteria bacterium]